MNKDYGCNNDKAQSMLVCHAVTGTKITVFDDGNMKESSGSRLTITVISDLGNYCATVPSFDDKDKDRDTNFIYNRVARGILGGKGKLNDKISSFVITVPK